jgi:hypothetical protein
MNNVETIAVIVSSVFIGIGFLGGLWCRSKEKKAWNNGISPNGKPWKCHDIASDGSRGYTDGQYYIWISYRVDK